MKDFSDEELQMLRDSTILAIHNQNNKYSLLYGEESPEHYKKLFFGITVLLSNAEFCNNMIEVANENGYNDDVISATVH